MGIAEIITPQRREPPVAATAAKPTLDVAEIRKDFLLSPAKAIE